MSYLQATFLIWSKFVCVPEKEEGVIEVYILKSLIEH